jgi:hypothetical protein
MKIYKVFEKYIEEWNGNIIDKGNQFISKMLRTHKKAYALKK